MGAIATILGIGGGAFVAFVYGRKADAHVKGELQFAPNGDLVMAVRPSIHAVGFRGVAVQGNDDWEDASVQITEVWLVEGKPPNESPLEDGFQWNAERVFGDKDEHGNDLQERVIVAGGETLTTTVLIHLGKSPPPGVIGWRVSFVGVARRALWIGRWAWEDRAFVPVPSKEEKEEPVGAIAP
jgi:hypothetical protein